MHYRAIQLSSIYIELIVISLMCKWKVLDLGKYNYMINTWCWRILNTQTGEKKLDQDIRTENIFLVQHNTDHLDLKIFFFSLQVTGNVLQKKRSTLALPLILKCCAQLWNQAGKAQHQKWSVHLCNMAPGNSKQTQSYHDATSTVFCDSRFKGNGGSYHCVFTTR